MVFGVRSTRDNPLRTDERSLGTVRVDVVEVKGQQFMKKKLNSGLSGVKAEEEESTEEKQGQHASAPVSLYSHVTSIIKFNGLNFFDWYKQIRFHLGVLDLDLALLSEKPTSTTSASSDEDRSFYKAWERSNRLSLMFMRMIVVNNIKSTIKKTKDAKEFMKSVEKCSQLESADKSLAGTLMSILTNIKFDGSRTIHEHILEIMNLAVRLKTMEMEVNEKFLVTFILNSLPSEYGPFHMNYNTLKDKWNVHELQSMLIQEETLKD
ncbi:uncharacterized protein LOC127143943 [Cucumis melo]|uniref:Uncharacterized protein LOC127143943 n=1 Tax=Cucumis melo TaxID=3656 RepID=A0ABM3KBP6_CUCME|nr:uncharacterized protein LOC127143943 [Cucumis melo]